MTAAVLTSKGQITIPKPIRDRLGVDTGDRVEFVELDNGGFAMVPATRDVSSLKGLVPAARTVSLEAMRQAVRSRAGRK